MSTPKALVRSTPEAESMPSSAILAFLDDVHEKQFELHGLMLLRHGHVVAEGWWSPYIDTQPQMLYSLSKSFTSTAVGLAAQEGLLSVDDPVIRFFPDKLPEKVTRKLASMRVRHLLTMSTGHNLDVLGAMQKRRDDDWVAGFLALRVPNEPGAPFVYNNGATYMLSAIVQQVTGQTLLDYLEPRLFKPLGIPRPTWQTSPQGINAGAFGLNITTEAIAHFGQLYLQKGVWQGKQIVPASWVSAATSAQVSNGSDPASDWAQGYGYQFWQCRHGAYRGDGAFGQFCVVMPAQDAVLAITAGQWDMQAVLNSVWEHLLPTMGDETLPEDPAMHGKLKEKLAKLALAPQTGQPTAPVADRVSGKCFRLGANKENLKSLCMDFDGKASVLTIEDNRRAHRILVGQSCWEKGVTALYADAPEPIAASGAWTGEDEYTVKLQYTGTPYCRTLKLRFAGDTLLVNQRDNVSFGPLEKPEIKGRVAR